MACKGISSSPFSNTNKAKTILPLFMDLSIRVSLKNKAVSLAFPSPPVLFIGWTWLGSKGLKV